MLKRQGLGEADFRCPARPEYRYVYHCYRRLGPGNWPNWMVDSHVVTRKSPGDTWLLADHLLRGAPGPHSATEKAFNYLCADGHVGYHAGRPRDVYR